MARSIYRRLTGRARTLGGYSQLWIAPDHILLLRSTRFRERYWRFALADIQAVVVTELPARLPLQAALSATTLLWALASTLVVSAFAKWFFLITGGLGLALVILDIARGPRCRCFLHTAVSREPLSPVHRMRIARKFLAQLQPAVEEVQGAIAMERMEELDDRSSAQAMEAAPYQPPEIASRPGYLPEVVFGAFLANATLILLNQRFHVPQVGNALLTTLLAEVFLLIVTLFRRGSRDFRRYTYLVLVLALLGIGWDLVLFGQSFAQIFSAAVEAGQHGRPAPIPATSGPAFDRVHGLIAAGWRIGASVIGFAVAYLERRGVRG
jgi:hypothetical protein